MDQNLVDNFSNTTDQMQNKKNMQEIRPWLYKPKKSRFGTRRNFKYNEQHWTPQQNQRYLQFITIYLELVKSDSNQKRKFHLNRILSKFIGTRSPVQCRSHHQRMIKTYGTPQNLMKQLGQSISRIQGQKLQKKTQADSLYQKQTQYLTFPDFSIHPCFLKHQEDDSEISLQMLDSNQIMPTEKNDVFEF